MRKILIIFFCLISISLNATIYYVAPATATPAGSDSNPGTITQPWGTWAKGMSTAVAGDTVYFRGGVYYSTQVGGYGIYVTHSGTAQSPICFFAYPADYVAGNYPIFDCSNITPVTASNYGVRLLSVSYIHIKGLEIRNVMQTVGGSPCYLAYGIHVYLCDYITLENMRVHDTGALGIKVTQVGHMIVKNCDTWNNDDVYPLINGYHNGGYGTGIEWNNTIYSGYTDAENSIITITGCRSWRNSDNGISGYSDGTVILDSCWMFDLGWDLTDYGDGVGCKFSASFPFAQSPAIKYISHCISAYNAHTGYSENQDIQSVSMHMRFNNNIAYKNGTATLKVGQTGGGFHNYVARDNIQDNWYRNNIAYGNKDGHGNTMEVYFWGGAQTTHNTWDIPLTVTDADFISVDSTGLTAPRKPNGSLPDINFLKLSSTSRMIDRGIDVGFPYSGAAPDLGYVEYNAQNPPVTPLVIITTTVTPGTTQATCGGNVTDDGGGSVSARGVCWGLTGNPTISGSHTSDGTGSGVFASYLTGLTPSTTYHVRAYATNEAGTGYGADVAFTTGASGGLSGDYLFVNGKQEFYNNKVVVK